MDNSKTKQKPNKTPTNNNTTYLCVIGYSLPSAAGKSLYHAVINTGKNTSTDKYIEIQKTITQNADNLLPFFRNHDISDIVSYIVSDIVSDIVFT